jgi:hypothetical protein
MAEEFSDEDEFDPEDEALEDDADVSAEELYDEDDDEDEGYVSPDDPRPDEPFGVDQYVEQRRRETSGAI